MDTLRAVMESRLERMQQLAAEFERELSLLPDGSLTLEKRGKRAYYYHILWDNGKRRKKYLTTKNAALLNQFQKRQFIQKSLPLLHSNIRAAEQFLSAYQPYDPLTIRQTLAPAYQDAPLLPEDPQLKSWEHNAYDRYQEYPQFLTHETASGLMVRSKAESMIADALTAFKIPFHYEEILQIEQKLYAPDFTILHPLFHRIVYWEHFGLMDDDSYALSSSRKIMDYRQAGILLGDNLIATFEDKNHPLTMREIHDTIRKYFLLI